MKELVHSDDAPRMGVLVGNHFVLVPRSKNARRYRVYVHNLWVANVDVPAHATAIVGSCIENFATTKARFNDWSTVDLDDVKLVEE